MNAKIIKIGNSRGIRFPKYILKESGITDEVELLVKEGKIIIKPVLKIRENWDKAFAKMHLNKDDILLDPKAINYSTKWDDEEWEW
ncbi:MAG: AbrB/MazE/SpoVT family DNA-binding domain-containing protein [Melioribacteraceae bacterium]|nr:AbrB/MazE/SpoVT family DNA-binding domain-containing protein [Melioribacteraceae bacterium]